MNAATKQSPMTADQLIESARLAGKAGETYADWCSRDEVYAAIDGLDMRAMRDVSNRCESAHHAALTETRVATYAHRWTTATDAYDWTTYTIELERVEWNGRVLRHVAIEPSRAEAQCDRYASGVHGSWERDPREEERERLEYIARVRAETEAHDRKREARLAALRTLDGAALETIEEEDPSRPGFARYETLGVRWDDVRAEVKRRVDALEETDRAARWAKCRAMVPDGCVIVVDATPGTQGIYGWIPGRKSRVYYDVRVYAYSDRPDPRSATVGCYANARRGVEDAGTLEGVCEAIERGEMRIATAADVPPRAVLERVGQDRLAEIRKIEVPATARNAGSFAHAARTVWVGRALFADEPMVLDENGRLVTAKAVKSTALAMFAKGVKS